MRRDYFEGILQLRDPTEELLDLVWNQIEKHGIQVAKQVPHKNGVDIYVSSNSFLMSLGKKLSAAFNGQVKTSSNLHTRDRQSGKNLYRVTLLFELAPFKQGDIISYNGDRQKVVSVGSKIVLADLRTRKKKSYKFDDIVKTAILEG